MAHHRNQELWDDIYDLRVFTDTDSPQNAIAWKWAEKLADGNRLTQGDLICLHALIRACIDYELDDYDKQYVAKRGDEKGAGSETPDPC